MKQNIKKQRERETAPNKVRATENEIETEKVKKTP